eukprot:scaffold2860_cov106-Isochrysis_galbana.AAC.1
MACAGEGKGPGVSPALFLAQVLADLALSAQILELLLLTRVLGLVLLQPRRKHLRVPGGISVSTPPAASKTPACTQPPPVAACYGWLFLDCPATGSAKKKKTNGRKCHATKPVFQSPGAGCRGDLPLWYVETVVEQWRGREKDRDRRVRNWGGHGKRKRERKRTSAQATGVPCRMPVACRRSPRSAAACSASSAACVQLIRTTHLCEGVVGARVVLQLALPAVQRVCTDGRQKVTVVRNNHQRVLPLLQVALQPDDCVQVQVVGRLVQQ